MASAIQAVRCYVAPGPVEMCDRCSAGIRHVALVTYKDGLSERYGSECINKILGGDTSLVALFKKNQQLAERYAQWLDVLSRAPESMPRGREYYGSGLYFIADDKGKDIQYGRGRSWLFHPRPDWDKNQAGAAYVQKVTAAEYEAKHMRDVVEARAWLSSELDRIGAFLARVVAKGLVPAGGVK